MSNNNPYAATQQEHTRELAALLEHHTATAIEKNPELYRSIIDLISTLETANRLHHSSGQKELIAVRKLLQSSSDKQAITQRNKPSSHISPKAGC